MRYTSSLNPQRPVTPQQQFDALAGLTRSPYASYGQNQDDIMQGMGGSNAAKYSLAASRANADFDLEAMKARQELSLSGLQQLAEGERMQDELRTARSRLLGGFLNPILGGLFQ